MSTDQESHGSKGERDVGGISTDDSEAKIQEHNSEAKIQEHNNEAKIQEHNNEARIQEHNNEAKIQDYNEAKIQELHEQLMEQQKEVHLAAEIGQQLLVANNDLEKQLQQSVQEFSVKIEALEQEKHTLEQRLDQKAQMEKNYMDDIDNLKREMESQKVWYETEVLTEHATTVSQLKKKVATLHSEAEQSHLQVTQLEEKEQEFKQVVEELQSKLNEKHTVLDETCSEEMAQLHADLNILENEKMIHNAESREAQHEIQQLRLKLATTQEKVAAGERELEEQQCQTTAYYNTLQRARDEVQDLKMELDLIKAENQDHNKKGNSLFAEVEDRRVEAEKQLITFKVQNETLKKQYQMAKEQLHKVKLQMAALLQMSTGRPSSDHLMRTQEQLNQARSEIVTLTNKLAASHGQGTADSGNWKQTLASTANKDYVEFVEALIKAKDKELSELQKELSSKRRQLMIENQALIDCQQTLYAKERDLEKQIAYAMKLRVKLEEMEMKYEPNKMKPGRQQPQYITERIALSKPETDSDNANTSVVRETVNKENTCSEKSNSFRLSKGSHTVSSQSKSGTTLHGGTGETETDVKDDFLSAMTKVNAQSRAVSGSVQKSEHCKNIKKVRMNDDVDVFDISNEMDVSDGHGQQSDERGEVKGRQRCQRKTVKIPRAPQDQTECKTQ